MNTQKNTDVRVYAMQKGVRFWRIAQELGVAEATLSRWLRFDLAPEKKEQILTAIDKLSGQETAPGSDR